MFAMVLAVIPAVVQAYWLEGYEATADLANTGFLTAVIDWTDGASPMPQGSLQIPACERAKIRNWVSQGAQNN